MWDAKIELEITSIDSVVETEKFGFPIRRVNVGEQFAEDIDRLRSVCSLRHLDETIFLQFDSTQHWIRRFLTNFPGQIVTSPDTNYWMMDSKRSPLNYKKTPDSVELAIDIAGIEDIATVEEAVRDIFHSYKNHYSSNPRLDKIDATSAYVDWARSSVLAGTGMITFLLKNRDRCIGYALVESKLTSANVLLAGILPEFEGSGAYRNFLICIIEKLQVDTYISTQSSNIRVQRSWATIGFRPVRTISTIHLQARDN